MEKLRDFYEKSEDYKNMLLSDRKKRLIDYIELVKKYSKKDDLVLDVGCGAGDSSFLLNEKGLNVIGFDISFKFIKESSKKINNRLNYVVGDVLYFPFKEGNIDVLCSNAVIEHINDVEMAVYEMKRILRKNGTLIILAPNILSPLKPLNLLLKSFIGKKIESPFYKSKKECLIGIFSNILILLKKKYTSKIDLIYIEPNLDFIGPDYDAVFKANPVDIKKLLIKNNFKIIRYQKFGENFIKRLIATIFPSFAPVTCVVAKKL